MKDVVIEDVGEDAFADDVSDEALEAAGLEGDGPNFTLWGCTMLNYCPGP